MNNIECSFGKNKNFDKVKNKAYLEMCVCGKKHVISCDETEAEVIEVSISQQQSCGYAFAGDEICYTIKICNRSGVDLCNVEFFDIVSRSAKYERNSFKYNGACVDPEVCGQTIKYVIPVLKKCECAVITFDAKVY